MTPTHTRTIHALAASAAARAAAIAYATTYATAYDDAYAAATARLARTLHDSDTGELIGTATPAQIDASDAAGDTGHILIDTDGDVVTVGTWSAQQPGVRRVWVSA